MKSFTVSAVVLCVLTAQAESAVRSVDWCYHLPTCNYTTWPSIAAPFCNGTRQSPIDINTTNAAINANLTAFTFLNFSRTDVLTKIENTGRTIKVTIASGVGVSDGGLSEPYDSLQFHLHWGNGNGGPGSEHTVDGKQFPMEMHIVNIKSSLNGNTTLAVQDRTGLAALGFLIEARSDNATESPASWRNLTSYLSMITEGGQSVAITDPISLNSLLDGLSTSDYFRYDGSLTTPSCNEAVVWTVFNDTIKISADLINLFSTTVHIEDAASPLMVDVFRGVQSALPVQRSSSPARISCSLGLLALGLALWNS